MVSLKPNRRRAVFAGRTPEAWRGVAGFCSVLFFNRCCFSETGAFCVSSGTSHSLSVDPPLDYDSAKMFHLHGPQLLQMLEKSLRKSLPESLKVRVERLMWCRIAWGKVGKRTRTPWAPTSCAKSPTWLLVWITSPVCKAAGVSCCL